MRRWLPWPQNLPGQLALLVAITLFCAQAINFALFVQQRRQIRHDDFSMPAIAMTIDRIEAIVAMPRSDGRPSAVLAPRDPLPDDAPRATQVEVGIRKGLADAGIATGRVHAVIVHVRMNGGPRQNAAARGTRVARHFGVEVRIAVELPGRGWFVTRSAWTGDSWRFLWPVFTHTLLIYVITLVPLLWIGHRIARPLRTLASAARDFTPGSHPEPVEPRGPEDVRAVIAAFNHLTTRVSAMLDEKDRMLGAIGHDLRTPLAALRVRIESVEDELDRARMADTIDEMHRTLEDILSLARLGRPSEPLGEVDLAALVDAVVEDFRDLGAEVTFEEAPRLPMRLRPALMRRAVRNLIENAVKYGGVARVRLTADAHEARIAIMDRGPGIPQDKLGSVFDPFTRLETSRNRETGGIGLGLALARAIVGEAGGTILLENRESGGLVATILLSRSPQPSRGRSAVAGEERT